GGGAPGDRLYVQFLHLLPLTLAAGAWLGGSALMLKVNAILGALSLLMFYAFCTRLVRPLVALGATLALAVNFVQVYFARDAYSEIIAQFFLFAGLFVLWDARAAWDRRRGFLAGLLLGTTCLARIDSFVYLVPLSAYVFGEIALATGRERRRFALAVGAGVAGPAALGAVDLYWFSRGYFHLQSTELRGVALGVGAALVGGVGAVVLVPLAGVTLAITMLYVARPSIFPNQVWAMRRFLPVTIPGLLILGAWAAEWVGEWVATRRSVGRWLVPALVIAAAVVVPAWQLEGMFDMREQAGALQAMNVLC